MNLFTGVEILIMGSIIGVLLIIVIILSISEFLSRKKDNYLLEEDDLEEIKIHNEDKLYNTLDKLYNTAVLKVLNEELTASNLKKDDDALYNTLVNLNKIEDKPINVQEMVEYKENKIEEVKDIINDDILLEEITEIEPLIQEEEESLNVVKIESEELLELNSREKAQIELLKIEEQLEHESSLEDTITNLEAIEEENAIISYQDLVNTKELNIVTCDDGDEPITIDEVFKLFNESKEEDVKVMEIVDAIPLSEAYQGDFSSTPYLSPINGLETESLSEIQLENTANLEKLDREIRKTNEFLNILNELKKNLE